MPTTAFLGVAHIHTPDFIRRVKQHSEMHVKAVYDHQPERGEKRAAELEAPFVADMDSILNDPEVGSVIICSETARHLELVTKAAAAGKHIFCEKPLAIAGDEAGQMASAVKQAGVIFQTGFAQRGSPAMQFLRQEAALGHLGTITRMRHTNGHGGALGGWFDTEWHWFAEKDQAGGGGYLDLGAHSLDIILWVMRGPCGEVTRVAGSLGTATRRYGDIDEFGAGLITFQSGAVAIMEASWVDPKLHSPVELTGTEGQIHVFGGKVFYYSQHVPGADGGEWTRLPESRPHAFELFLDALNGLDVPLVPVEEAAEESRVMHELYRSAGQ